MKRWTQDYRYIVWTFADDSGERFDLYVGGVIYRENMDFETFWAEWKKVTV